MADLNAQLSISADASGVEAGVGKAKRSLADLGKTAATAGREASAGLESMGAGAEKADVKVNRSANNLINSIQRTTAAIDSGSRSSSKYFETLAQQRGVDVGALRPYLDQLDQVNAKQAAATGALGKGTIAFNQYGVSAKQNAAALRQVPAQLTDIIVGLQGGQAPLTVLLQQGGQLRDVFGGVVPAVRALGGAVLGLINPVTVSVGAFIALAVALEKGRAEAQAFDRALISSGNAAGATSGQLQVMAQNIDAITGTQAGASAALTQFAGTGAVAAANLERFTTAAILFEKAGGGAISETAKKFADLRKAPLDAVVKLNEGMNFLTRDLYLQIRALEEQGRSTEAANLAQKAFADTISNRSTEIIGNLGLIERGWGNIKKAISEAADAALNVGRVALPEAQLKQAQQNVARLEELQRSRNSRGLATGDIDRQLDAARQFVETQSESVRLGQRAAASQAQTAAATKAQVDFDKLRETSLTNQEKRQREIAKATEAARVAGVKQVELDKVIANINERYKDPKVPTTTARVDARAQARLDIQSIQSAAAAQVNAVSNAERILDALRSSGLVGETAYYQEKRRLLEEDTRLKVASLEAENQRLAQETLNKKDSLDRDREILKNRGEIARLQADTAAQSVILNAQETSALTQKAAAILSARQAQEDYFATIERQQQRQLQSFGRGNQQRELTNGINQIEDRYASQRRDADNLEAQLAAENRLTAEARSQLDMRRALADEFQARSITSYKAYYEALGRQQSDFSLGASEALTNYLDETRKVGLQVEQALTGAFKGAEDALVSFVTTGKLDFKSLADSIISDIARIAIRQSITGPLAGALGGLFSGLFGGGSTIDVLGDGVYGGARAAGGPVATGKTYLVGERGPELFTPGASGQITANSALGSKVTVNVINQGGGGLQVAGQNQTTNADGSLSIDVIVRAVEEGLASNVANRSGSLSRAMESGYGLRPVMS